MLLIAETIYTSFNWRNTFSHFLVKLTSYKNLKFVQSLISKLRVVLAIRPLIVWTFHRIDLLSLQHAVPSRLRPFGLLTLCVFAPPIYCFLDLWSLRPFVLWQDKMSYSLTKKNCLKFYKSNWLFEFTYQNFHALEGRSQLHGSQIRFKLFA